MTPTEGTEIRGQCQCGKVQYLSTKEPLWCAHCHCSDCRKQVASPVATFVGFAREHFSLTRGEFAVFRSSPGVRRSFCADCGTPMAYETDRLPNEIHILLGTLDKPENFPAGSEVFCKDKLPWFNIELDGPSFDTLPRQGESSSGAN